MRLLLALSFASLGLVACGNANNASMDAQAVASRIQKVGSVQLQSAGGGELRSGEQVYQAQCGACHSSGALGAPKLGDNAAWGARIGKGYDALLVSALKGKGSMAAQGGGAFSDLEIGRAVVYMANKSGGNLAEPKK